MKSGLFLPWSLLVGLFFLTSNAEAARATTLILGKSKPEPKIDTPPTAEEENVSVSVPATSSLSNETSTVGNVTKLTGVPQIDYIYDPNLPRELNGYNLTDYPFYNSVPEDIEFKCDGLHDGFYASVPHKCQVYHHCLFGTRYDFLCANYTAFDQKTFICHFASEVDCKNSPRYFNRNEALYKAATTTTAPTLPPSDFGARRPQDSHGGRKRRPYRRRKPFYDYYDDYEEAAEDEYYDDGSTGGRRRKRPRPINGRDSNDQVEEDGEDGDKPPPSGPNKSVFDRPRIAPKIRRPVPVNERDKYDYSSDSRIIAKEPAVEKKRIEDAESSRKQTSNRSPDYYEPTGSKHLKNIEPSSGIERERDHKEQSEYERDRDREREHKEQSDYERDRDRDRDRERDRDRSKERDERPYRDRRPPKKRRRPDDLDDEYDDYEDIRRHRTSTRNRPRYEEYDDYEYDDRHYRNSQRNREADYRSRDHEYDRDKPHRNRDSDYDRPVRNRDRIRDDERPIRNRDIDDRPIRSRDEERPVRSRDEERPIRTREEDRPVRSRDEERLVRNREEDRLPVRSRDEERPIRNREEDRLPVRSRDEERPSRTRNEQLFRNEGKNNKNRNRPYHAADEEEYRGRDEVKPTEEEEEEEDRLYKYKETEEDYNNKQRPLEDTDKYTRSQDRNRNQEPASKYRDSSNKFANSRVPSREESVVEQPKLKSERVPDRNDYNNERLRPEEQTERPLFKNNERGATRAFQKNKLPSPPYNIEEANTEDLIQPVPALRPAYITKPSEAVTPPARKPFNEPNGRKPNGLKKLPGTRLPTSEEEPSERQQRPLPPREPPSHPTDQYEDRPLEGLRFQENDKYQPGSGEHHSQQPKYNPPPDLKEAMELNEKLQQFKNEEPQVDFSQTKLKVPHEDSVAKEDLAPKAPKFPLTSPRRRPFLPSRNGNANLPRNLLPVGVKALQSPRGFQVQNKKPEQDSESEGQENLKEERQDPRTGSGGIEFRAKVSTAIGVDQPKLTQFFQDVQSSSELELPEYEDNPESPGPSEINAEFYPGGAQKIERPKEPRPFVTNPGVHPQRHLPNSNTQDLSGSHMVSDYSLEDDRAYKQENNPNINFRPTLKPTDFPQLAITDTPLASPQRDRNLEPSFKNRPINQPSQIDQFAPKNPILFQPFPPKSAPVQSQPQLGPQSFYSENPKFKTTIKIPEPYPFKPSGSGVSFNPHVPVYQAGIPQNVKPEPLRYENAQRHIDPPQENLKHLNLKFPSQNENADDANEFDVSLNDALQPISTLHPRNVPTGVFLSNWQRGQQQSGGFKRRIHVGGPPSRQFTDSEENKTRNAPRTAADSRNAPKNQKLVAQRQASSNTHQRFVPPPVYHSVRPVTSSGNYLAILTQ